MRIIQIIVLVGLVGMSRVGFGQGREEISLPGQHPEVFHTDMMKSVKLYPNPATDVLSLKLETPSARHISLTLHNIIGNSVEVESEMVEEDEIRLKVKDLPAGYYLLAVHDETTGYKGVYKFLKR